MDGRFVFDLKDFSVMSGSQSSSFMVSMAREMMNLFWVVGRVLQTSRFILSAVSRYPTIFVVLSRSLIGLLGSNCSYLFLNFFQISSVRLPRRMFCSMS